MQWSGKQNTGSGWTNHVLSRKKDGMGLVTRSSWVEWDRLIPYSGMNDFEVFDYLRVETGDLTAE